MRSIIFSTYLLTYNRFTISALTLSARWQEKYLAHKRPKPFIPKVSLLEYVQDENWWEPVNPGLPEKQQFKKVIHYAQATSLMSHYRHCVSNLAVFVVTL